MEQDRSIKHPVIATPAVLQVDGLPAAGVLCRPALDKASIGFVMELLEDAADHLDRAWVIAGVKYHYVR